MKKSFKAYVAIWAILLAVFNVLCFVTPNETAGMSKFGGAFWIGYIFITLAFIGQLLCTYIAFRGNKLQKLFYKLPLISVSFAGLILTVIVGTVCMIIPDLPNWVGIIACLLVLAFNVIVVIRANTAAEIVSDIDDKIKTQTAFVKLSTVEVQNILNRAKTDRVKAECRKAYEAIRYSDPMSSPALAEEEAEISAKIRELKAAVTAGEDETAISAAQELVLLIGERNNKCKLLK